MGAQEERYAGEKEGEREESEDEEDVEWGEHEGPGGKEDVQDREKQKYTLVMVQNRLELLELTRRSRRAHLRLEDKHRHLYKLADTPAVRRSTGYKHNPH